MPLMYTAVLTEPQVSCPPFMSIQPTCELYWFMNVPVEEDGTLGIVDGLSAPGISVSGRAEMPLLVLISNCPQINNPCNGFDPTPIRVVVERP